MYLGLYIEVAQKHDVVTLRYVSSKMDESEKSWSALSKSLFSLFQAMDRSRSVRNEAKQTTLLC